MLGRRADAEHLSPDTGRGARKEVGHGREHHAGQRGQEIRADGEDADPDHRQNRDPREPGADVTVALGDEKGGARVRTVTTPPQVNPCGTARTKPSASAPAPARTPALIGMWTGLGFNAITA